MTLAYDRLVWLAFALAGAALFLRDGTYASNGALLSAGLVGFALVGRSNVKLPDAFLALVVGLVATLLVPSESVVVRGTAVVVWAAVAAITEEVFFRGALWRLLSKRYSFWIVAVATSLGFALVHIRVWSVYSLALDFGAGMLFAWQREVSGTWTVPAATHLFANWTVIA